MYKIYEMYEIYKILVAQKRFRSPPTVSTYDRVNFSALQATIFVVRTDYDYSSLHNYYSLFA